MAYFQPQYLFTEKNQKDIEVYHKGTNRCLPILPGDLLGGKYSAVRALGNSGTYAEAWLTIDSQALLRRDSWKILKMFRSESKKEGKNEKELLDMLGLETLRVHDSFDVVSQCAEFTHFGYTQRAYGLKNLEELLAETGKGLRMPDFYALLESICKQLSTVHEKGLVHSDIKSNNIVLSQPSDTMKDDAMDFLAKLIAGNDKKKKNNCGSTKRLVKTNNLTLENTGMFLRKIIEATLPADDQVSLVVKVIFLYNAFLRKLFIAFLNQTAIKL